jgi:hypothetical protein
MERPLPGLEQHHREDCVCGCGVYGTLRRQPWRDGLGPHVKTCPCRRCSGRRYKQQASRRERKVARMIEGKREWGSGAGGRADVSGVVNIEETANRAVLAGLKRWWYGKGTQAKVAAIMKLKTAPPAFVASWSDAPHLAPKPQLVVMRWDDFRWLLSMRHGVELPEAQAAGDAMAAQVERDLARLTSRKEAER